MRWITILAASTSIIIGSYFISRLVYRNLTKVKILTKEEQVEFEKKYCDLL